MTRLNYRHLHYFWTVARLGSITQASRELHVSQPAISAQLRSLERALGEKVFAREGRGLALTDIGRVVQRYAEEIFTLGRELEGVIAGKIDLPAARLNVGVTDAMPKLLTYRLLEPALAASPRLSVREDKVERLLAELATHTLDLVLTDAPVPSNLRIRAFSHLLGECGVTLLAVPALARRLRRGFPASLDGAPFLLPGAGSTLDRSLEQWFGTLRVRPRVVAEVEDSAVLTEFGRAGAGVFAVPAVMEAVVKKQYGVSVVGRAEGLKERFYAVSVERKITHPAVRMITRTARSDIFG